MSNMALSYVVKVEWLVHIAGRSGQTKRHLADRGTALNEFQSHSQAFGY